MRLDPIDQAIISALLANGRQTLSEIGAHVKLSAPAVKRRIDRLEAEGVITGYTALVNAAAMGDQTTAFVELFCRDRTSPADILAAVEGVPEVTAAYTVTGEADALLLVRAEGMAGIESVLERIRSHPNTARTRSEIVLSTLIERTAH